MNLNIEYITDERGIRTAVKIPYQEWLKFHQRYRFLKQYSKLKKGLMNAFKEVENIETGKSDKISLAEFLNEC